MISKSIVTAIAAAISSILLVAITAGIANAGEIKLLYVGALRSSITDLIPEFEKSSGVQAKGGSWSGGRNGGSHSEGRGR